MIARVFFWPGDWLAAHTSVRSRRAAAVWLAIAFVVTVPVQYPWRSSVALVWLLSEMALVLAMLSTAAAETPVELESCEDEA